VVPTFFASPLAGWVRSDDETVQERESHGRHRPRALEHMPESDPVRRDLGLGDSAGCYDKPDRARRGCFLADRGRQVGVRSLRRLSCRLGRVDSLCRIHVTRRLKIGDIVTGADILDSVMLHDRHPFSGGVLYARMGYRAPFVFSLILVGVDLILRLFIIKGWRS
jgi:hypothetical protein